MLLLNINYNNIIFFTTFFKISIKYIDCIKPGANLKTTCNI